MRVFFIFIGFGLTYYWVLVPEGRFINPFPFSDQVLSEQSHWDYIMQRVFPLILALVIWTYRWEREILIVAVLLLYHLIDYLTGYNEPYFWLTEQGRTEIKPEGVRYLPVSSAMIILSAGTSMVGIKLFNWLRWKLK